MAMITLIRLVKSLPAKMKWTLFSGLVFFGSTVNLHADTLVATHPDILHQCTGWNGQFGSCGGDNYREEFDVGDFTYSIPPDSTINSVTISGTWGNQAIQSSALGQVYVEGILVSQCVYGDTCPDTFNGPLKPPFSFSVSPSDFPLFLDGVAPITALQTAEISMIVSGLTLEIDFDPPDNGKISPPELRTLNSDGSSTSALIKGGITSDNSESFESDFQVGETIQIVVLLEPESIDVGANSELFVIAAVGDVFLLVTPGGLVPWDGNIGTLIPFDEVELATSYEVSVLDPFGGEFTLTSSEIGSYRFFVGYTISGGVITYTDAPIELNVSE